ncbi:MAG TPA: HNH endonuclease signature motif containing protein [Kofleriaceae bacterium]|nr:HNH endonuclease signature motif containing protein [Kofleriaceae bacterium]
MSRDYIPRGLRDLVAEPRGIGAAEAVVGTPMVIDHIVPESLGGPTEEANLWLACPLCNAHKGVRITVLDANTGEIVRMFNPRQQTWVEHFEWTLEGDRIVGRTPIGRATARRALHRVS